MYEYSAISHVQQQQKMYSTYMYYIIQSVSIILIESGLHIQKLGTPQTDLVFDLSRSRYNQEFLVLLDRKACFISKTFMMYVIHILSWPQLFTLLNANFHSDKNETFSCRRLSLGKLFRRFVFVTLLIWDNVPSSRKCSIFP